MRVAAAIGLGLFAVGAGLAWVAEWVVVGAIVMIASGTGLVALVILSASREALAAIRELECAEAAAELDERLPVGWTRR
jgi:predicted permease